MTNPKIFVAGHNGMVGSSLIRILKKNSKVKIITKDKLKLDLTNQLKVKNFFTKHKIDEVYLAAAKVGGIYANNTYRAEFIYKNLMIQTNIIHNAFLSGVKKILFLGSSCIYPKKANQPMKEEELLTGALEQTNEPYAIAKIAGIKLIESYNRQYGKSHGIDYRSVMPTNLYGPGDNYDEENSHVIPALIRRFHTAKIDSATKVTVWGTGLPKREFMHVDDLAQACIYLNNMSKQKYYKHIKPCSHINIGSGKEISIKDLAYMIKDIIGFKGKIEFNEKKLEGNMRKLLDSQRINKLDWYPKINLRDGLVKVYKDYKKNK